MAVAAGCGAPVAETPSAQASQPSSAGRKAAVDIAATASASAVSKLLIQCLVSAPAGDPAVARDAFCARVEALAGEGAPVAAATLESGESIPAQPGVLTLLAHATVRADDAGAGSLLSFNIRPFLAGVEQYAAEGTQPRTVRLPAGGDPSVLDDAIDAALAQSLPWRTTRPQRLY